MFRLNKSERIKFCITIFCGYIITLVVYYTLNSFYDSFISSEANNISNNTFSTINNIITAYEATYSNSNSVEYKKIKEGLNNRNDKKSLSEELNSNLSKYLTYGQSYTNKTVNTLKEWQKIKVNFFLPYIPTDSVIYDSPKFVEEYFIQKSNSDTTSINSNNNLREFTKNIEYNKLVKADLVNALEPVIDEFKVLASYKARRYTNGFIQFVTLLVGFTGIFHMILFQYVICLKEKREFKKIYTKKIELAKKPNSDEINSKSLLDDIRLAEQSDITPIKLISSAVETYIVSTSKSEARNDLDINTREARDTKESQKGMVRYYAWAVPSIGFIGTVIGISDALENAHKVITDAGPIETKAAIQQITASLGVAFDTTLIALLISIPLLLLIHSVTRYEEKTIEQYYFKIKEEIIDNLVPGASDTKSLLKDKYIKVRELLVLCLQEEIEEVDEVKRFKDYLDKKISQLV